MADRPSKSHALWRLRTFLRHVDIASTLEAGLAGHHADAWAAADAVARDLLRQLTPDEIAGLIGGRGFWSNGGVPRLKLPALHMTDGPSGARGPLPGLASACVPCGAALGATWDLELCRKIGALLGQETKVKGAHILLGPTVNLQRHPLGGRNFECFSEDPQLSAALAAAYIEGVQEQGVACCVKHLVANDQEHRRSYISAEVSEKALREVYLVPFEAAVEAGCMAVMTGYNRVNGTFCSENRFLLQEILREEWGFRGCVMSDWTGTHSVWGSLEAGLDLEMPEAPGMFYKDRLSRLFHGDPDGLAEMTKPRALAVLRVMARLGLQPGSLPTPAPAVSPNSPELRELLAMAAAESVVLLKNGSGPSGGPLPLGRGPVAVLGPSSRRLTTQGGGSAAVEENPGSVNLVEALRRRLGEHAVHYGRGTDAATRLLPPPGPAELRAVEGEGLLKAEFVETSSWEHLPIPEDRPAAEAAIRALSFGFFTGVYYNQDPPSRKFRPRGPWAVRYRGELTSQHTGRHELSLAGTGRFRLLVRGQCLIDAVGDGESLEMGGFLGDLGAEQRAELELSAGQSVEVCVLWAPGPIRPSRLHLGFRQKPWASEAELQAEATELARRAEAAVVVLGSPGQDSEGRDQSFEVCGLELVRAVAAVQPRTIVCLNVGAAKQLPPDLLKAGAVLVCWLGGQEAAEGLARVLCGEGWGPSGRLPATWPYKLEDTAIGEGLKRYPGVGTQVFYSEGVLLGHRWFQSQGISPQFCFGHGLAYTSFEYSDAELRELRGPGPSASGASGASGASAFKPEAELELMVRIRNSGVRAGKEVLQVFAEPRSGADATWRLLLGFTKVALYPGEVQVAAVKFLAREATRHWCERTRTWAVEPCCDVLIASSGEEQWRTALRIATPATA